MLQPDAFCEHNAAKCDCARRSAPDPAGGDIPALPDFKRADSQYVRNSHNFTVIRCNIWFQGSEKGEGKKGEGGEMKGK